MAKMFVLLLGFAFASAEVGIVMTDSFAETILPTEERNSKRDEFPTARLPTEKTSGKQDEFAQTQLLPDPEEVYRRVARELSWRFGEYPKQQPHVNGQNDFEKGPSKPVILPRERFTRIRRQVHLLPHCGIGANPHEYGTPPPDWHKNVLKSLNLTLAPGQNLASKASAIVLSPQSTPTAPEDHLTGHALNEYLAIKKNLSLPKTRDTELVKMDPYGHFESYQSRTGIQCRLNTVFIGCSLCVDWKRVHLTICIGVAYKFRMDELSLALTFNDRTFHTWEHRFGNPTFDKYSPLFHVYLCIPYQFSFAITLCADLVFKLDISFTKTQPSKFSVCPSVAVQLYVYHFMLFELPCYTLEFHLFRRLRIQGSERARITFEPNYGTGIKSLFAVNDLDAFERVMNEVIREDDLSHAEFERLHPPEKERTIQNLGERPKVLKKGTPTVPVNWELADKQSLEHVVVLYTEYIPNRVTAEVVQEFKDVPLVYEMMEDAMKRGKSKVPLNVKVRATMGRACGGVIISQALVMTLCACVKFFYLYHKGNEKPKPEDYRLDLFTLVSEDIYVTTVDQMYQADRIAYTLNKYLFEPLASSPCFKAIEDSLKTDEKLAATNSLHMHFALMFITPNFPKEKSLPSIYYQDSQFYSYFGEVHELNDTNIQMFAMGMKKVEEEDIFGADGYELDPKYEMVKIPLVECPFNGYCRKAISPPQFNSSLGKLRLPREFLSATRCLCAKEKWFQLCDGVVGFPVVVQSEILDHFPPFFKAKYSGLSAVPVQCRGAGSMVLAIFGKFFRDQLWERAIRIDSNVQPPPGGVVPGAQPSQTSGALSNLLVLAPLPFILSSLCQITAF